MVRINQTKITCALYGLLLRGTVVDLLKLLSLSSLEPVVNTIAIGLFLLGLIELLKREIKFICISIIFFAVLWYSTICIHPHNVVYIKDGIVQFFIYSLPFMWLGYYFIKEGVFLDTFLPVARFKLILALFVQINILLVPSKDIFNGDYQTAAYSIIVGLVSVYYLALQEKKCSDIALSIIGTIVLLLCGSRGIFVAVVFFWTVYFVLQIQSRTKIILITSLALIFPLFSVQQLFSPIASIAESLGFSTHLTDALQSGAIFEDEQRKILYTGFLALIWDKPWGYGVMGDRYISYVTGLFWKPIYPHNIFLELMVDFGYFIGIALGIFLIYYLLKYIFFGKSLKYSMTLLVLACTSLIKLLFASSFWIDQMFFMLLGTLIAQKYVLNDNNKVNSLFK